MKRTFSPTGTLIWAVRVAMLVIAAIVLGVGVASGSGIALAVTVLFAAGLVLAGAATFRDAYVIDGPRSDTATG